MKHVLICFCFIFLLPYSFQMKNERYEMFAKKLFSSVQSYFGNDTHVSDNNNIIMLSFTNVKLINPILSKISYTYNETRPFYFTAKNVIFTFVSDVYSTISTYNAKSLMISMDLLFQITCDEVEFYNVDKMVATLNLAKCEKFFYSKSNYLGALKTYDFFTKNATLNSDLKTFYNNLIKEQLSVKLKQNNLIKVDSQIIFDDMVSFLNTKILDETYEEYTFHSITVKPFTDLYGIIKKDNVVEYDGLSFDFIINYIYNGEDYSQSAIIKTSTVRISNTILNFDFNHVEYDDCDSYFDEEVCKFIFKALYYKNLRKIFCDYFREYQEDYDECLKKEE